MRDKINCLLFYIVDLRTGDAIKHQPKRKQIHSVWYSKQVASEGRTLK